MFLAGNRVNNFLDDEQLGRLLAVLQTDPNRMICRLVVWLLATGCRYSEAINARWKDIDRKNRRWYIGSERSKNKRSRWVGLGDMALQTLDELAPETGEFEHLFTNRATGKPYASTKKTWDRLRNAAGLGHFRLHDCRHQHASMLANRGVSLLTIREQLGHAEIRMTASRYSHISASTLAAAAQVAGDAMQDALLGTQREASTGTPAIATSVLRGPMTEASDAEPAGAAADEAQLQWPAAVAQPEDGPRAA